MAERSLDDRDDEAQMRLFLILLVVRSTFVLVAFGLFAFTLGAIWATT